MPDLLAHALAATALQCAFGATFGFPLFSIGVFIAGLIAILIDLDYLENSRTPLGHSIFFAVVWVYTTFAIFCIAYSYNLVSYKTLLEITLATSSAYATHLGLDTLTREGIYTISNTFKLGEWFIPLSKNRNKNWSAWQRFPSQQKRWKNRTNADPILNVLVSIPALFLLILFLTII